MTVTCLSMSLFELSCNLVAIQFLVGHRVAAITIQYYLRVKLLVKTMCAENWTMNFIALLILAYLNGTVFFSHHKTTSAGLSAAKTTSRTAPLCAHIWSLYFGRLICCLAYLIKCNSRSRTLISFTYVMLIIKLQIINFFDMKIQLEYKCPQDIESSLQY